MTNKFVDFKIEDCLLWACMPTPMIFSLGINPIGVEFDESFFGKAKQNFKTQAKRASKDGVLGGGR